MIIVAGLGRCGTSLVCQMLQAGGLVVAGQFPDFEPAVLGASWSEAERCAELAPYEACKWIDPHRSPMRPLARDAAIIWLDRDPKEQAKSSFKLVGMHPERMEVRAMMRGLRADRRRARKVIGVPAIEITFEGVLADPGGTAERIGRLCERHLAHRSFDVLAAAGAVLPRSPECRPDLGIEILLAAREGWAK